MKMHHLKTMSIHADISFFNVEAEIGNMLLHLLVLGITVGDCRYR